MGDTGIINGLPSREEKNADTGAMHRETNQTSGSADRMMARFRFSVCFCFSMAFILTRRQREVFMAHGSNIASVEL